MSYQYDYVVVGVGGIGSAAVYWLSRLAPDSRILGLEQFELGHVRGGSQDVSRIIRKIYMDARFSELAEKSYEPWHAVEEESGLKLVHETGGLLWTTMDTGMENMVTEYEKAGRQAGSPVQILTGDQIRTRWPQFNVESSVKGVLDPHAGLVDAAMGNAAHQQCALARGAEIWANTKVEKLEKLANGGMKVVTSKGTVNCRKVIVTSGAWINQVLASCGAHIPVKVSQENVTYFATPHLKDFTKEKFPIFIYIDKEFDYYALPIHGLPGFKIGIDAGGHETTGDTRTFQPDPAREKLCQEFLQRFLPKALGRIIDTKVCLYTMTYDRTFLIDTLESKNNPDVIICCGAGHAFKFAGLFGKILSEMAIHGKSDIDISDFSLNRPAITDPHFKPEFRPVINTEKQSSKL